MRIFKYETRSSHISVICENSCIKIFNPVIKFAIRETIFQRDLRDLRNPATLLKMRNSREI